MFNNKTILITGGTGSFGQRFTKVLLKKFKPKKIIIFSRDELKQFEMQENFKEHKNLRFFIGDVRDMFRLKLAMENVDYVVHAAALKIVPVIKKSQEKSLLEIAKEIREFSSKEKKGFSQEDISGSTFSITSLNSTIVDSFNPLINPPEVGILGIGRISEETQVISENLTPRKICFFNLTFDHRVVDGFPAAKFLESIVNNIQNPQSLVEK